VDLIIRAAGRLAAEGVNVRVVSFPSWEIFAEQPQEYRDEVLPPSVKCRLAVEAGVTFGWQKWVGDHGAVIGIDGFGASAPGGVVMKEYGFTVDHVIDESLALLKSGTPSADERDNGRK